MGNLVLLQVVLVLAVLGRCLHGRAPRPLLPSGWLTDYFFSFFNITVTGMVTGALVALMKGFFDAYLPFVNAGLLNDRPVILQGVGAFLAVDFTAYVSHRIRHRVECLWFFHSIHHSQSALNPFTNMRTHPCDLMMDTVLRAVPLCLIGGSYAAWFWFAVVDYLWGYFVHADIRANLGPLRHILVTPQYHRIHHSRQRRHWNKNFSDRLVVWDYLFGTLHAGFDEYPPVGLPDYPIQENSPTLVGVTRTWVGHMVYPFREIARSFRGPRNPA